MTARQRTKKAQQKARKMSKTNRNPSPGKKSDWRYYNRSRIMHAVQLDSEGQLGAGAYCGYVIPSGNPAAWREVHPSFVVPRSACKHCLDSGAVQ